MRRVDNNLRGARQRLRLTQSQLAQRVGLSRQALNALELGRATPSTEAALRLARALAARVEELFWLADAPGTVTAEMAGAGDPSGGRAVVASVGGRWVAHPLPASDERSSVVAADAILPPGQGPRAAARVRLLTRPESLSGTLLCAGCAPALGILAARAGAEGLGRVSWLDRPSGNALDLLERGQVHIAGSHLLDEPTGEFNVPEVRRRFASRQMLVYNLVRWEVGLVIAPGATARVRELKDLRKPGVRIVQRPTAAAQRLLERVAEGTVLQGPTASSHHEAARWVALGLADAAIAVVSAARAFDLPFIPLAEERFDLVVPGELSGDPRVIRLLETVSTRAFRADVGGLGGLSTRQGGDLIARTAA